MTGQDLKECIAEVKYSAIPEKSKKMIMNVLYEKQMETEGGNSYAGSNNDGWIPCSERLPEAGKRYLVSTIWEDRDFEKSAVYDAIYGSDGLWHSYNYEPVSYKVIAWQPLPEPYKESD